MSCLLMEIRCRGPLPTRCLLLTYTSSSFSSILHWHTQLCLWIQPEASVSVLTFNPSPQTVSAAQVLLILSYKPSRICVTSLVPEFLPKLLRTSGLDFAVDFLQPLSHTTTKSPPETKFNVITCS